jgi:hypothetical protein
MSGAIAVLPYFIFERVVKNQHQTIIAHQHELRLFAAKITSRYREFPIGSVHDMSFRQVSGEDGMLYLHTDNGVYSFIVRTDPRRFMEAYRELKFRLREGKGE